MELGGSEGVVGLGGEAVGEGFDAPLDGAFGVAEPAVIDGMRSRGLIARAVRAYGLPQCLRITIGTAEECGMVEDALSAFARG